MPRMGRIVVPGMPHHIVQRGHNRNVVFAEDSDFERYLQDLLELKKALGIHVYAWCLMTNHVHLLLEPLCAAALGQLMKTVAARATRFRNKLEARSGTLWESRYKSSVVDSDQYFLACCRYIELNPVRARMVTDPIDYPWSSYRSRMGVAGESRLDVDDSYLALGNTDAERRLAYARFVRESVPSEEMRMIRNAVQRGQLTGADRFVEEIARITGRRIECRGPGRPKATGC